MYLTLIEVCLRCSNHPAIDLIVAVVDIIIMMYLIKNVRMRDAVSNEDGMQYLVHNWDLRWKRQMMLNTITRDSN